MAAYRPNYSTILLVVAMAVACPDLALARQNAPEEVISSKVHPGTLPILASASAANAQAKVVAATTPKATSGTTTTQAQLVASMAQRVDYARSTTSPAATGDLTDGRTIHGEAGVSIGTGGYRSAFATSVIPIGQNGTLGIAVRQTDFGKSGRLSYGWGRHNGSSQSVALSLDLSGDDVTDTDTPRGCAPGFRAGDRYIEPLWVTQSRGGRSCDVPTLP